MKQQRIWMILAPILILAACALGAWALVKSRQPVETRPAPTTTPLVRVLDIEKRDLALDVVAQGTVLPRTETTLIAQVGGQILEVSPAFEVGAFFAEGEVLVALDARDYEVAVSAAEAQVAQARLQLELEEAEARVAREEWSEIGDGEPDPLVLRGPQVARARAGVAAAEATLEKARLDLERTRVRAPFAGRVRRKQVDRGQFVAPGTPVAAIHAIDFAEVRLPVADAELAFLDLPFAFRNSAPSSGPDVELSARFAGRRHSWHGRIVRSEGEIDTKTRMLNLVARVVDPYAQGDDPERPPLAVGMFVEARIGGRHVEDVVVLPRAALRRFDGENQVLVVDGDERLRFREVDVLRLQGDEAVLAAGLEEGERVCATVLDVAVDGMQVRTSRETATAEDAS